MRGESVDHRTDTFSFGIVLYEMVTGRSPFKGKNKTPFDIMHSVVHDRPSSVSEINNQTPAQVQTIIERAIAYLYLPKNYQKPFQVIQFVPAGDVYGGYISISESVEMILTPFIKSGRAVFAVAFKGFKKGEQPPGYKGPGSSSIKFREEIVGNAIDLSRGLDYLETRDDIDASRTTYFGYSQGAEQGLIYTAVEASYRSVVIVAGGLPTTRIKLIAEANPIGFASHIRTPKLILNGRYDEAYPYKLAIEPLYKLLTDPKRQILYEAGHTPPIDVIVPGVNQWLDETLGPVRPN